MSTPEGQAAGKVRVVVEGSIGWVILDNPARKNAVSFSMWAALGEAVEQLSRDGNVRCIVLRGEGVEAFCAGGDISEFEKKRSERDANIEYRRVANDTLGRLQSVGKPTVAMISGFCMGGGVALAISCDLRIGAKGSRYGIPAARLGMGYDYAGIKRLSSLIGISRAKRMIFTASRLSAEEAHQVGLIDELVDQELLEGTARKMAETIAANAPLTISAAKFAADLTSKQASEAEIEEANRMTLSCFDSSDYVEGRRAFMEKRRPVFSGK